MVITDSRYNNTKEFLEDTFSNFEKELHWKKKTNQHFDPLGDAETESLHALMYDTLCAGSGGMGWDTIDTGESKFTNRAQPRKCNSCGQKNMFFLENCVKCGSDDLKTIKDSRWGISAKSHLDYLDEMIGYRLTILEPTEYEPSCRSFTLKSYFIPTKDEYLTEYATRQLNSPKSNGINFLPYNQDFYRSSPRLHLEATIDTNGVDITYFNPENDVVERGPERFYEKSMEEIMDKKTFGKNRGVVTR